VRRLKFDIPIALPFTACKVLSRRHVLKLILQFPKAMIALFVIDKEYSIDFHIELCYTSKYKQQNYILQ